MRIQDVVHFSPNVKVTDIDLDDPESIIVAFDDRIRHYYFEPARILTKNANPNLAFASGTITITAIEAITNMFWAGGVGQRFRTFVSRFPDLHDGTRSVFSTKFYDDFRNGLVHEGRIKKSGQFSHDYQSLQMAHAGALVVNPCFLLSNVEFVYFQLLESLKDDMNAKSQFISNFYDFFRSEIIKFRNEP